MRYRAGLEESEWSVSQCQLLLYSPQCLSTLPQLLLLVRLQGHVDDICQATVTQDTRYAQEYFLVYAIHALIKKARVSVDFGPT